MIYSAFITVLISVRILPVGFDSSDGSSAGTSAEGECAVWCGTLAVPLRAAVPGQGSGPGCHPEQEQHRAGLSAGNRSTARGDGDSAGLSSWSCPGMQLGLLSSAGCCRDPEELAAVVG